MEDVSAKVKVAIVEQNLAQVKGSIYDSVVKQRVFKKVGDEDSAKAIIEQLNKFEKMKDEYTKILKELKSEYKDELLEKQPAGKVRKK